MAAGSKAAGKPSGGSGMVPTAIVFGLVTAIAVGTGWYLGSQIRAITEAQIDRSADAQKEASAKAEMDAIGAPTERPSSGHDSGAAAGHGTGHGAASEESQGSALSFFSTPSSAKLEPIVSNIGSSGDEWVRLEVAVIYGSDVGTVADAEKYAISEAIIAMLRRKKKSDLNGPSGYLQFREDLDDAVAISTGGRAISAKILSLVVE